MEIPSLLSNIKIDFLEYDLPNGMHVILHKDNSNPIVSVNIWYHVGSKNDDKERSGFAHLFEHMMFQGSKHIGKTEHFSYIQNAGGYLNASTNPDRTNYFETVPSNQLETVLWLESDRMMNLNVTQENFDNQRDVVKEEKRQRYDNKPYGQWLLKILNNSYLDEHPYHEATIGRMEHLDNAELNDAIKFYSRFYTPNNAVIVIAGDIEIDDTKKLIEKYFSEITSSELSKNEYPEQNYNSGENIEIIYDNISIPSIYIAYKIPAIKHKDMYTLNIISCLLGEGRSSRLYNKIVYEEKLAKGIGSHLLELEIGGLLLIHSTCISPKEPEASINRLLDAIDKEIRILLNKGITEYELEKSKNIIESSYIESTQSMIGIADLLAYYYTYHKNTGLINTELDRILAITKKDADETARKYLTNDNRIILKFLPNNHNKKE